MFQFHICTHTVNIQVIVLYVITCQTCKVDACFQIDVVPRTFQERVGVYSLQMSSRGCCSHIIRLHVSVSVRVCGSRWCAGSCVKRPLRL